MRMLLTIFAIFAVADRAATAPVPKEILKKFPNYYPLFEGTTWEYVAGETKISVEVTDYEVKDGVKTGTLSTILKGKRVSTERIRVDATGVYRTHINTTKVDPPILILKFGIKDETEWTTKSKVASSEIECTFKLAGEESLEVPAGKYKAVRVEGTGKIAGTPTELTYYFVENVGIAQLVYSIAGNKSQMQLTKFTLGKAKD